MTNPNRGGRGTYGNGRGGPPPSAHPLNTTATATTASSLAQTNGVVLSSAGRGLPRGGFSSSGPTRGGFAQGFRGRGFPPTLDRGRGAPPRGFRGRGRGFAAPLPS